MIKDNDQEYKNGNPQSRFYNKNCEQSQQLGDIQGYKRGYNDGMKATWLLMKNDCCNTKGINGKCDYFAPKTMESECIHGNCPLLFIKKEASK